MKKIITTIALISSSAGLVSAQTYTSMTASNYASPGSADLTGINGVTATVNGTFGSIGSNWVNNFVANQTLSFDTGIDTLVDGRFTIIDLDGVDADDLAWSNAYGNSLVYTYTFSQAITATDIIGAAANEDVSLSVSPDNLTLTVTGPWDAANGGYNDSVHVYFGDITGAFTVTTTNSEVNNTGIADYVQYSLASQGGIVGVVPEPSSAALLGLGALGLLVRRKR